MKQSRWMTAALLIWMLAAPLAQAFYNPNTGRWLNRDPVAENGGPNIAAFVSNEPTRLHDPRGLPAEPPAPGCAPCKYEGWEHRMKADAPDSADAWGFMDGNEDVSPGIDFSSGRDCCACGKAGRQYRTVDPKCRVKIWIASDKEPGDPVPNQNTQGHAASIWDHESQHAHHFSESVRNRDNLYKSLGTICVPDKCSSPWIRTLVRFDHAHRALRSYKDAYINCRDASGNCQEQRDYDRQACSISALAFEALSEFLACMNSECGSFSLVGAISGFNTCR